MRLGVDSFEDSYFIELDLSTESPNTLARKMAAYRALWSSGVEQASRGVFPKVLWIVPDLRRHQVVVDACSRQPAESWQLHVVTVFEDAVGLMVGGAALSQLWVFIVAPLIGGMVAALVYVGLYPVGEEEATIEPAPEEQEVVEPAPEEAPAE